MLQLTKKQCKVLCVEYILYTIWIYPLPYFDYFCIENVTVRNKSRIDKEK